MTVKNRRIHLFLQIFYLLTALYEGLQVAQIIMQPDLADNLFASQGNQLLIITLLIHVLATILSVFSGIALWSRAVWAYGLSLFTSGILFAVNLFSLSFAIQENSFHIIPVVLILLVLMQSFPFLLRHSYRGA